MRADGHAFQALNANLFVPHRDFQGEIPFFILSRSGRKRTVVGECGDGQVVAVAGGNLAEHLADEGRGIRGDGWQQRTTAVDPVVQDIDLVQIGQGVVHGL